MNTVKVLVLIVMGIPLLFACSPATPGISRRTGCHRSSNFNHSSSHRNNAKTIRDDGSDPGDRNGACYHPVAGSLASRGTGRLLHW